MADRATEEIAQEVADILKGEMSSASDTITSTADSYIDNLRLLERSTGDWFNPDDFKNASRGMAKELSSYSFEEAASFSQEFMNEFAMRDNKQANKYLNEVAAQVKAFDVSMNDIANIIWRDENSDFEGRLFRYVGNIAGTLEDVRSLNTKAANILEAVNENINGIYGVAGSDENTVEGLTKSTAVLQSVEDSAANAGLSNVTDVLKSYAGMNTFDIMSDSNYASISALTGMDASQISQALRNNQGGDLLERIQDNVIAMGGTTETGSYALSQQFGDVLGDQGSLIQGFARQDISGIVNDAEEAVAGMDMDDLESLANNKEAETVSPIEAWWNKNVTASFIPVEISSMAGDIGMSFKDLLAFKLGYDLISTVTGPIFSKLGGGFINILKKSFSGGSKSLGFLSGLSSPSFLKGLSNFGKLSKPLSFLPKFVSIGTKFLTPLSFIEDLLSGVSNTKDWLNGDTISDYFVSALGGLIGGDSGIGQGNGLASVAFNMFTGALKGAATGGAFGGPAGAIVGGIAGSLMSAIGGKRISQALDFVTDKIGGFFSSITSKFGEGLKSFGYNALNFVSGGLFGKAVNFFTGGSEEGANTGNTGNSAGTIQTNQNGGGFLSRIKNFFFPNQYANGSSYISNDGLAYLHQGEAVLTKDQASVVRDGADGGISFGTNSTYMKKTTSELLYEIAQYSYLSYLDLSSYTENMESIITPTWAKYILKYVKNQLNGSTSSSDDSSSDSSDSASFSDTGQITKDIYNYFKDLGFTDEGIAGILGNMKAESGLNPSNIQDSYESTLGSDSVYTEKVDSGSYTNFANDSAGYGLVQFTNSSYKQDLLDAAKANGTSISDTGTQLGVFVQQLKDLGIYESLKNATSASEAADLMLTEYERPAYNNFTERRNNANSFLEEIQGYAVGSPWIPEDQLAVIHQGEMIVPAEFNPYNDQSTVSTEYSGNNMDVVDVLKWQISRLEAKMDKIISAIYDSGSTGRARYSNRDKTSTSVNALSPLSESDYIYNM